jgi:hypothetical protein
MHPDQRPASVAEFRADLHAFSLPEPLADLLPAEREWIEAAQENRTLLAAALALVILALLITLLAPPLP